jgi:Na+-translocating ferredoxin:NAD+ oxidoreductase RNF subunit RnfB
LAERKFREKIRNIYEALPKLNCGLCGFGNCGQFARAVAEGRASPFGCQQNPWSGYRISRIIGAKVPAYSYQFQPASVSKAGVSPWPKALREELRGLSQTADDILARIAKLKERTLEGEA